MKPTGGVDDIGRYRRVHGAGASVAGGLSNVASGTDSSISGGAVLTQPAQWGWAAGSVTGNVVVGNFESP